MTRLNGYSKELEEQIQTLEDQILQTVGIPSLKLYVGSRTITARSLSGG